MSGLPMRIFSRRSRCNPFITPMMRMSALTPTTTPPMAITLIIDSSLEPRRLRRYRQAISNSRRVNGSTFGAHGRKQDYVTDVRRTRKVHEQPVHSDSHATGWRHAVFHGAQVVLVHATGLLVAGIPQPGLVLETRTLVNRIVQLAECVRKLLSVCKQLEPLGKPRIATTWLRQRRQLARIVQHEGGLHNG